MAEGAAHHSRRLGGHQAAHEPKGDGIVHRRRKARLPRQRLLLRAAWEPLDGGPQVPACVVAKAAGA